MMFKQIEMWAAVDQDGDYAVAATQEEAKEAYTDDVCADLPDGLRMVRVTVSVPLPEPIELTGEVQVEEGAVGLKVA